MDDTKIIHQGGCQCGNSRFTAKGTPKFISNCHCHSCRKATGAAFSTWVGFDDEKIEWTTSAPNFYASSTGVQRGFCNKCGTPLTYAGVKWPGETHFLIGVLDTPTAYTPNTDVFIEDALLWTQRTNSKLE